MDQDPTTSGRNRVRAMYPFQARNSNELSLKAVSNIKQYILHLINFYFKNDVIE